MIVSSSLAWDGSTAKFIGQDAMKRRRAIDAGREAIEARIRLFDDVLCSVVGEGDTGQAA